jgi:hypothetical protein
VGDTEISVENSPKICAVEFEEIPFVRVGLAKGLNAVFTQAGVEFSLVHSKSRREADQSSSKDSSKKSCNQESADAP